MIGVLLVSVLLGLRHATDPDHLAAVTSLIAGERERSVRQRETAGRTGHGAHVVNESCGVGTR